MACLGRSAIADKVLSRKPTAANGWMSPWYLLRRPEYDPAHFSSTSASPLHISLMDTQVQSSMKPVAILRKTLFFFSSHRPCPDLESDRQTRTVGRQYKSRFLGRNNHRTTHLPWSRSWRRCSSWLDGFIWICSIGRKDTK